MGNASIKVLHIDTEMGWRGGQQQAAYLVTAMRARSYQTAVVCQPHSVFHKFCNDQRLLHFVIKMHGELDVVAGFKLANFCRQKSFNILHLHTAHALAIGLWTKLFFPKLKLIAVRRVDFHIRHRFKYKNHLVDKIVCISDKIKQVLLADGIPGDRLVVIHSGIDLHKFRDVKPPANFREELKIPPDHILVGTVAAMAGHKDYPNLLKAAKIVIDQMDTISFCAVGDGPEEKNILQLAQQLKLGQRFIFAGFRNDVGNFLKIFDLFVLASRREGLGTSILDAQAVGLPVIACNTGGIPEIVSHQHNGLLVPPKNVSALADALILLANDKDLRNRLGQNGLTSVRAFDINLTIEKNLQLYQRLLND